MKKILLIVGIGFGVLMIAGLAVGIFIGPIIKTGMETLGPKITQVSVKVDRVDVSFLTGSAKIKGLLVGNPQGYKSPEAIKLSNASVALDPLSVFSNKIVVRSIHVESPEITYDGGLKGNNLNKIMDNVNSAAKAVVPAASSNQSANTNNAPSNKPAPKIEVDDFLITGAKVHVNLPGLSGQGVILSLPDIHLTGLGKGSDGITPAELTRTVLSQVTGSTVEAVTKSVAGSGKAFQNLGKNIGKEAGENINSVTKSISGLFGK